MIIAEKVTLETITMTEQVSFKATKIFVDRAHFPYGFARSGDFTKKQTALIEAHGQAYKALDSGEREAVTDEEREFVRFCRHEKAAETDHEKVWQLYRRHLGKRQFYISMGRDDRANSTAIEDSEPLETEDA